jgi:hypothetical protein
MLGAMLLGTIWEVAVPALVALGSIVAWLVAPRLRKNPGLRAVLVLSVALVAAEAVLGSLLFGFFFLSGGWESF